tara:strand:+ start:201 stop:641 length:441 start_codon:yes stop_codon:yes gene_type:complete
MKKNRISYYYANSELNYFQIFNNINLKKYKKCIIFLEGEIGSGKTTIVRQYIKSIDSNNTVTSPTFTLIHEYQLNDIKIFHYDLYRINDAKELLEIGLADYLIEDAIHFFEWPNNFKSLLPKPNITIELFHINQDRLIKTTTEINE